MEKRIGNKLLVSYSYIYDGNVKTIKKLIESTNQSVQQLYVPTFATKIMEKMGVDFRQSLSTNMLEETDTPELLVNMASLLKEKYNININFFHNSEINNFPKDIIKSGLRAFVLNGEYYVNIDNSSVSDPLHEFIHVILGSMKYSNNNEYEKLVYSIKNHPKFNEVSKVYDEARFDQLEETFIKLFTETVRKKILVDKIFTQESFDKAIKNSVKEMFDLKGSVENESMYDLLDQEIKDILVNFNSSLIENSESLYNKENAISMIGVATALRNLMKEGNLKEICND